MQAPTPSAVLERVRSLASEISGGEVDGTRPLAEAGFDSLAYAELALALEEAFGARLGEADVERLATAEQVADAVSRLVPPRPGPRIPAGIGRHQRLAVRSLGPILRWWYRVRMRGLDRIPARGPAIVCANHNSLLDIPFLTMAVSRGIWFMAKMELFKGAGRPIFHALGGFPVRRGLNDLGAVDLALAVLESGRVLGMFPEGTRSPDELLPFLPGAAWIALVTGAPLVPIAITGAAESLPRGRKIPKRTNVTVAVGDPIPVEREPDPRRRAQRAEELTAELRRRVEALLAQAPPA